MVKTKPFDYVTAAELRDLAVAIEHELMSERSREPGLAATMREEGATGAWAESLSRTMRLEGLDGVVIGLRESASALEKRVVVADDDEPVAVGCART